MKPCQSSSRQARTLKRRDQVIGKADDLKIEVVGGESTRGDIGEGEILAQFADTYFDGGSTVADRVAVQYREKVPQRLANLRHNSVASTVIFHFG